MLCLPKPTIETWKKNNLQGQFKVHVKTMGLSRWLVMNELPTGLQYDEWLLLGKDGIPLMYWNKTLQGVMLI
jgi:hypothetical protein